MYEPTRPVNYETGLRRYKRCHDGAPCCMIGAVRPMLLTAYPHSMAHLYRCYGPKRDRTNEADEDPMEGRVNYLGRRYQGCADKEFIARNIRESNRTAVSIYSCFLLYCSRPHNLLSVRNTCLRRTNQRNFGADTQLRRHIRRGSSMNR